MSTPESPAPAARSAHSQARPGPARRIFRVVLVLIASLIAFLAGAIVLGAWIPAIPKAGVIGPVLGGQYPFHIALLALVGLGLGVLAWRSGLVRWGQTLTALTAVSAAFALAIGAVQYAAASKEHTRISFGEIFTQIAYPGLSPTPPPPTPSATESS